MFVPMAVLQEHDVEPEAPEQLEWSVFGLSGIGWLGLLSEIVSYFFSGPHVWRSVKTVSKKSSRLLRLLVARFLYNYQDVYISSKLEKLSSLGGSSDYVIYSHLFDETNQLILRPFQEFGLSDSAGVLHHDTYDSVCSPTMLSLGLFRTSFMDAPEHICYRVVKLVGLTAQAILGGIFETCLMFVWLFKKEELNNVWKLIAITCDDASANNRLFARLENVSENTKTLLFQIACMVHLLHTSNKPCLKTINIDALFRWANVARISAFRQFHWSLASEYIRKH